MEELIVTQAATRYRKAVDGYKSRLKDNPDLKLSEYCKEIHTNYRGVIDWMRRNGIITLGLKRETSGETVCGMTNTGSGDSFIRFVPSNRTAPGNLRGISITFADWVNLTLQESSVESVISLLTIYQSRQGGAGLCSD